MENSRDIRDLHKELFFTLYNWSKEEHRKGGINPFFLLRSPKDPSFQKGFVFPGNARGIYLTFWTGSNTSTKTPNFYLEVTVQRQILLHCKLSDSEKKKKFLAGHFRDFPLDRWSGSGDRVNFIEGKTPYPFLTTSPDQVELDFKFAVLEFLNKIKRPLDNHLQLTPMDELEDFVTPFTFLPASDFDSSVSEALRLFGSPLDLSLENTRNLNLSSAEKTENRLHLNSFNIQNYQGIQSAVITDLPVTAPFIFLTGENGFGKTSVLQALALGFGQPRNNNFIPADEMCLIQLEVGEGGNQLPQMRSRRGPTLTASSFPDSLFLGYGPARLTDLGMNESSNIEETMLSDTLGGLFDQLTPLLSADRLLFNKWYADRPTFDALEALLQQVSNGRIHKVIVEGEQILFQESLGEGQVLPPVPKRHLAAGLKSIIILSLDIYVRLQRANGHLNPLNFQGIVLIDELENHLHPILQRELPATFSAAFPKVQFIASTHSPIPLLGAPSGSIVLRVNRNLKNGVTVERLDDKVDFSSMLPNAVLTSEIFGLKKIVPEGHVGDKNLRTENSTVEIEEADKLQEKLDSYLTPEGQDRLKRLIKK